MQEIIFKTLINYYFMKNLFFFIVLMGSFSVYSQIINDTISSKKLGETRSISIFVPDSYKSNPKKTYPLLVLLDGDYLLNPFLGVLKYGNYWDDLPETIIVSINQNIKEERFEDCNWNDIGLLTPKSAKFLEFVGTELLTTLTKKYRLNNFKIIAGHDLTAGYINYFLGKENMFNGYISLSPEFSPGMQKKIIEKLSVIKQKIFYYQSTADGDTNKMKDGIKVLDVALKSAPNANLIYKFDEIQSASHYSMVVKSIPNALYFFFEGFQPISNGEYQEKILTLKEGFADYYSKRSENIEKAFGSKMKIRLSDLKIIESAIIRTKSFNEYEPLAVLANQSFPKAMLGEYYMAQYYERKDDIKRAVKSYLAAFQMDEIGDYTKKMMMDKSESFREQLKKEKVKENSKSKGKKGKAEEVPAETVPTENAPSDATPTEGTPTTETPVVPTETKPADPKQNN